MPRVCMQVDLPHQFNFSLLIGFALSRAAKIEADTSFLGLLFTPDFLETTPRRPPSGSTGLPKEGDRRSKCAFLFRILLLIHSGP